MAKETKKPEAKQLTIEERMTQAENALNAIIMYVNTVEKWRRMEFNPPETEKGKNEKSKSKETVKEDSGEKTAK